MARDTRMDPGARCGLARRQEAVLRELGIRASKSSVSAWGADAHAIGRTAVSFEGEGSQAMSDDGKGGVSFSFDVLGFWAVLFILFWAQSGWYRVDCASASSLPAS